MSFTPRSHSCGALRAQHIGQVVHLCGWAHRVRDLGGLTFIDLRDRTGLVQLFIGPTSTVSRDLKPESCIAVTGTVQPRDEHNKNPKMPTGDVDVEITELTILNAAGTLPFQLSDEEQMQKVNEELRVKYRYLDLRRPSMYRRLALRASAIRRIRHYLDERDFLEIETPIITKSTPEGARDYLVPYRLDPGKFYALPQSPQQYKQLLMVAGCERYYQIAKCFRDEAQRADRQPEFTQLDLEMSFTNQEEIVNLLEGLTIEVINALIAEFDLDKEPVTTFTRLTYDQSMEMYGSDKPDLRFGLPVFDVSTLVANSGFGVFTSTLENGGVVRGLRLPGGATYSRKEMTELEDLAKSFGAKGMAWFAVQSESVEGSQPFGNGLHARGGCSKFLAASELEAICQLGEAHAGDAVVFIADAWRQTCEPLARLRTQIGNLCNLKDPRKIAFVWILDFPLVDWNPDEQRWDSTHHPFTSPKPSDLEFLESDPARVRADCYDLVFNGMEWASARSEFTSPTCKLEFSRLLVLTRRLKRRDSVIFSTHSRCAPPHGGIAPGIDRLVMMLTDDENIREVIAFPKMGNGYDPMMDAPSTIDTAQWADLGLTPPKAKE